jgi:hypothetical protein
MRRRRVVGAEKKECDETKRQQKRAERFEEAAETDLPGSELARSLNVRGVPFITCE